MVEIISARLSNVVGSMVHALLPLPIIANLSVRVWPLIEEGKKPRSTLEHADHLYIGITP